MIRPDPIFPSCYAEARTRFLEAARARGARLEHFENAGAGRGPDGETLAADVAVLGPADAPAVLLVHSGTHGVEGYCGSGVQQALLRDGPELDAALRTGAKLVMLHAINPWGFAWGRRVTEDNVDLNRNFRDFPSEAAGPDVDYDEVHALMLPASWPPDDANRAAISAFVERRGAAQLQFAVSHGQRSTPDGMFFAGHGPTWSNRTLREVLRRHVRGARQLAWIDLHTGLGPSGHGELIYNGREDADHIARARRCWGARVTSTFEGSSASVAVAGPTGNAAYDECPGTALACVAIEYGTAPFAQVLEALRFDHWVHARAPGDAVLRAAARDAMLAGFYVDTADWKAAVLAEARTTFAQAAASFDGIGTGPAGA